MSGLTDIRRQAIEELINISFGQAVASLAEVLGGHLQLDVPKVQSVSPLEVINILSASIEEKDEVSLVQQAFSGDFFGEAVLALPGRAGENLMYLVMEDGGFSPDMEVDKLRLEVILEVSNIVIGACMGQFSSLLNTVISYSPPNVFLYRITSDRFREHIRAKGPEALLIYTKFAHEERAVTGYLFFFLSDQCLDWLYKEVDNFLEFNT